jgi:hypothetical protein
VFVNPAAGSDGNIDAVVIDERDLTEIPHTRRDGVNVSDAELLLLLVLGHIVSSMMAQIM